MRPVDSSQNGNDETNAQRNANMSGETRDSTDPMHGNSTAQASNSLLDPPHIRFSDETGQYNISFDHNPITGERYSSTSDKVSTAQLNKLIDSVNVLTTILKKPRYTDASSATPVSNSIPYADMNASNFRNFDIDWFKFDGSAYTQKRLMSYL